MPATNSRSSPDPGLDRRELGADLLKLFENLLQQVLLHDDLLGKSITFLQTAMKTMPGLGLRLYATGIAPVSGNERNCFEKMSPACSPSRKPRM